MDASSTRPPAPDPSELARLGTWGVLALGYRGVELWRAHRDPIPEQTRPTDDDTSS